MYIYSNKHSHECIRTLIYSYTLTYISHYTHVLFIYIYLSYIYRDQLLESFSIVKPSSINSVPTLYNKIYDGILKKVSESSPLRQRIFHTAMSVARRRNECLEFNKPVSFFLDIRYNIFERLVYSKLRAVLGGNVT